MSNKYKFHDPEGLYFITTTVVYWIDVFTRNQYKGILTDSLMHCVKEKGLIIYAYVFMSNHIHLIAGRQPSGKLLSEIMRDFKKYTAMQLIKAIGKNPQESRKKWMLWMFERAGKQNSNNTKYQFWQQDNHPVLLKGEMIDQRLNYTHNNPVKEKWVNEAHEYFYSSARNYAGLESAMKITSLYDGVVV